jgi:predicted nuclease with TOPRIM domain
MDDHDVVQRIDGLVAEEHQLRDHASTGHPLTDADRERLRQLEVQLDQLWDLLRRRRAREQYKQDPDAETLRAGEVVEGYQQ